VKLRSAPLDDACEELKFVLEQDGRRLARTALHLLSYLYRALHWLILTALRLQWRSTTLGGHR
jgi:hypothetical protein